MGVPMSILDEPSTISRWLSEPGPIELRHRDDPKPDPQPGKGIVLAVAVGLVLLGGGYALARWLA